MTDLHAVVETPSYLSDARDCRLSEDERARIVDAVASNPGGGEIVQHTGGVRKVRVAGRGKGKSGGYRVITAYLGDNAPVYLLALPSKGERANFSEADKKAFRRLTSEIKAYRKEKGNG